VSIPFIDLKSQYASLGEDIRHRINQVLDHGRYIMGPEVLELEERLGQMGGTRHVLSCSSGTDALVIALMAYGVGPGDAVFTTPFTFVATAEAIVTLGATPVFVDIDHQTLNLDTTHLEGAIQRVIQAGTHKPRGIIPVDIFGLPADYDAVAECAKRHDLFVLGDGAQSMGSAYHDRPSASCADLWTTSFFPAKPLGCYGDGGAVFTGYDDLIDVCRSIRIHGQGSNKYDTLRAGINGRLDTLQAAVLLAKLPTFPQEIQKRQWAAQRYTEELAGCVRHQIIPEGYLSAWAQYSIMSPHRKVIQAALAEDGIPTAIYYSKPLPFQPALSHLHHVAGDFPVAEAASLEVFSLPMHPYLEDAQIKRTAEIIKSAVDKAS